MDELQQSGLDLIVGEEGHVPWVSHRQTVPVTQQRRPRLHTHTHTQERGSQSQPGERLKEDEEDRKYSRGATDKRPNCSMLRARTRTHTHTLAEGMLLSVQVRQRGEGRK